MLVIKTHSQRSINNSLREANNEYKIVDCPSLTVDQQQALVTRATPILEQDRSDQLWGPDVKDITIQSVWIKEQITGWSYENDDYLTASEQAQKDSTGVVTEWDPSFPYIEAAVWEPWW
jgi:hypothetical protein